MHTHKPNGAQEKPAATAQLPPAPAKKLRRTRGSTPRLRSGSQAARVPGFVLANPNSNRKAASHANGSANHAAAADGPTSFRSGIVNTNPETRRSGSRANGHGHAFSSDSGEAAAPSRSLQAGSDDASGISVAIAPTPVGAGTDREACAALAEHPNGRVSGFALANPDLIEGQPRVPSEVSAAQAAQHSPGEVPLPADPAEFVEEIHQRVDLFEIWQELLESKDEKIKQRAVEKLTEMRYKGAQSFSEEPQQIVIDIDSAVARRAAQGALK